jgi:hypothetical protein
MTHVGKYIFGGAIVIRTHDQREIFVDFFHTDLEHSTNTRNPFSVQSFNPPGKSIYYDGADSQRLCEIIESAWRETRERDRGQAVPNGNKQDDWKAR